MSTSRFQGRNEGGVLFCVEAYATTNTCAIILTRHVPSTRAPPFPIKKNRHRWFTPIHAELGRCTPARDGRADPTAIRTQPLRPPRHLPPTTHAHTHTHTLTPSQIAAGGQPTSPHAARRHAARCTPPSSRQRTRCRQPSASAARSSRRSRRPHHPAAPRGGDGGDARDWRPRASRCCHHAVTPRPPRRGVDTRHRDRRTLRPWRPRAAACARAP